MSHNIKFNEIPIEVLRGITKFYQGYDGGEKAMHISNTKRQYIKMVKTLNEVLGADGAKKELERLQKVYPDNYDRQAAEVMSRIEKKTVEVED